MPSVSPGRYQSRLFKFFHRQSQYVSDRIQRTLRQVQVSTSWSIEAILYPVLLLVKKAVDSAGKQLNAQSTINQHYLNQSNDGIQNQPTPAADSPIVNMVTMVKNLPSRQVTDIKLEERPLNYIEYHQNSEVNEIVKASLPAVQGIATHLGNRHLVLVTADNKILDILTLKQQQRLQDRIITEIADYWRLRRLAFDNQVVVEKKLLPEIENLLRKITANNPASLPATEVVSFDKEVKSNLLKLERLELIDAAIAKLELSTLVPVSRAAIIVRQGSSQLLGVVQQNFNLFLYGSEITRNDNVEELENQTPPISTLIWQAINYFFGNSTHQAIPAQDNASSNINKRLSPRQTAALLESQHKSDNDIENPWLTFDDLFAQVPIANASVTQQKPEMRLSSKKPNLVLNQTGGELVTQIKSSQTIANSRKSGITTASQQNKPKITILDNRSHHNIDIDINNESDTTQPEKSDFIEIKASTVGYDKHPLELALEWLDNLMLWLEDKFVKVIRLIQKLWKR